MTQIFDMPMLHLRKVRQGNVLGQFDFDFLDPQGEVIATVREPKPHIWKAVFHKAMGREFKSEHFLHVDGLDGEPLLGVDKHPHFVRGTASVLLPNSGHVGDVKKVNWTHVSRHFQIVDPQGEPVADIPFIPLPMGTPTWNFQVLDRQGVEIAQILTSDPRTGLAGPGLLGRGGTTLRVNLRLPDPLRALVLGAFVTVAWFDEMQDIR